MVSSWSCLFYITWSNFWNFWSYISLYSKSFLLWSSASIPTSFYFFSFFPPYDNIWERFIERFIRSTSSISSFFSFFSSTFWEGPIYERSIFCERFIRSTFNALIISRRNMSMSDLMWRGFKKTLEVWEWKQLMIFLLFSGIWNLGLSVDVNRSFLYCCIL